MRVRHLAPVLVAIAAWGVGTAAALRHVTEVRRLGVVPQLVSTLLELAIPYLALGLFALWTARGLARFRDDPASRLARLEPWIGVAIVAAGLGLAVLYTTLERPATMAAYLWGRGGTARAFQTTLERALSPAIVASAAALAATLLCGVSVLGWWRSASRGGRRAAAVTVSSVALVALILVAAPRLRRGLRGPADASRPNVLLIVVDSLRPDRALDPAVAPAISALASRSVRFTDARTPCALGYPAIASLLTGKHPVRHGVRDPFPAETLRDLGNDALPRVLGRAGYKTIAVGGHGSSPLRELDSGFAAQCTPRSEVDRVVSSVAFHGHPWLPAILPFPWARVVFPQVRTAIEGSHPGDVTQEAVAAWRRARGPFFLTVVYDNAHLPYVPVWPQSRRAPGYSGPNRYSIRSRGTVEQPGEEVERENARALYDDAVRSIDRAIGRLLTKLERDRLTEGTIVVLLADHGENLLDDGGSLAHGDAIDRDRSNAVPWTIAWPGRLEPRDVAAPVLLTDVAPTLLSLLALPGLPDADGVDRAPLARGLPADGVRPALLETGIDPGFDRGLLGLEPGRPPHVVLAAERRAALVRAKHRRLDWGPYALAYKPRPTGAAFALYRRDRDPGLTLDVSAEEPEMRRQMIAMFYAEAERLGETEVIPPGAE